MIKADSARFFTLRVKKDLGVGFSSLNLTVLELKVWLVQDNQAFLIGGGEMTMKGVKEISPEIHCPKLLFPSPIIAEEHSTRSLEEIPNCQTTKY